MKILKLTLPAALLMILAVAATFALKEENRTTTIQSVIYFSADTSIMVEFHSVDIDTAGTEWQSFRNERIFLTEPEAPAELEQIGGCAQIIGEALRTSYSLE